jgi:hypothetical protein
VTAILLVLAQAFAHLAVAHDAAGALLSPAGVTDPIAWLAAGGFLLTRLGSSAMLCVTLGLGAARLARAIGDRARRARFLLRSVP